MNLAPGHHRCHRTRHALAWVCGAALWMATSATAQDAFDLEGRREEHWAWAPVARPEVPAVRDTVWPLGAVDRFLLAALDREGLAPGPEADRATLLRRATFLLTGLPPQPEDVRAFLADTRADAWERQVDRLLASPDYGERQARQWMDLMRYAETYGHEFDYAIPEAWQYRDYLIRAFEADVPYDQLVREHVAGDLLEEPRRHPGDGRNESIIATGALFLNQATHAPVDVLLDTAERTDNQIDVLTKSFLGLTVACARCHDHKFDAISTQDYYALAGILKSTHQQQALLDPGGVLAEACQELQVVRDQGDALLAAFLASAQATPLVRDWDEPRATPEVGTRYEGFDGPDFGAWRVTGQAFGEAPTQGPAWDGAQGGPRLIPAGVAHSGRLAGRLQGVLRSPTFRLDADYVHYRLAGQGAQVRLIVEGYVMDVYNALLFEGLSFDVNTGGRVRWHVQDVSRHRGRLAHLELLDHGDGWLAVDEIRFAEQRRPATSEPSTATSVHVDRFDALTARRQALDETLPHPLRVLAAADGTGIDEPVAMRGSPQRPGVVVPRRFLAALGGATVPAEESGSGRRQLAEWMVAPDNPFPARVLVNRVWQSVFGLGLVPTPDNFGVLGKPPSHPRLLDWLADWTRTEANWSLKRLYRELLTSRAFRLSSAITDPQAEQRDPTNRWLHRMRLRRLEGEALRDAMLYVSGQMDRKRFGPPVPIHLTDHMQGRGRPGQSGPLDGAGRRSIYLEVRRNFLSPFLLAFDGPIPFTTTGRRSESNVPAQFLSLMNDPFVVAQAGHFADRVRARWSDTQERIAGAVWASYGRAPRTEEVDLLRAWLAERDAEDPGAWRDLCQVLWNSKEFLILP